MGKVRISDELIVIDDIEDDPALSRRLALVSAVETIELMVAGSRSYWEAVVVQRHGRPVAALRPVEGMPGAPGGDTVEIALPPRDDGLATFGLRLQYWDTHDNQIR